MGDLGVELSNGVRPRRGKAWPVVGYFYVYSGMRLRPSGFLILAAALFACNGESGTTAPAPPAPPPAAVLLRDVVVSNLPSPFYHFEYDAAGRIKFASYASELTRYDVTYDNAGRISEMQNNILVNHDRLQYFYDDASRVSEVRYVDPSGTVFTVVFLTYDGAKLTELERDRRVQGGFIVEKRMAFSYYPDGNLMDITEHRPPVDGTQNETTTIDHFEQYDTGINVDGFDLIHDDFFDHLVLLPGVQLQKGNPARQTRTGDGVNFSIIYTYDYDGKNRPLTKHGTVTLTNGADVGRVIPISSTFSYYN